MKTFTTSLLFGSLSSTVLLGFAVLRGSAEPPAAETITPAQQAFFESKVRPLLVEKCVSCHGANEQKGGLRLDSIEAIRKGNASGPAVLAGDPEKSPLVHVIRYDGKVKMPPTGRLQTTEVAILTEWVKMGAPWPGNPKIDAPVGKGEYKITAAQRSFWSFQPVRKSPLPRVKNTAWVKSPIDAFVLAKLEAKGLAPAPKADRRTLIRRACFDLIGLPPTPQDVTAFLADKSPNAYEKVIDRLLASPQYGERQARHWLDIARYADSNGLDENKAFAHAYRYRDYVVNALNKDKPYNVFVQEQIAGDLLPTDDAELRNERITATGFLTLGAKVLAEQDKPKFVMDIVDEQIEVVSKSVLGLTVACARCHDHKFDPLPTKDYYALAGIFKSTRTMADLGFVSNWMERDVSSKQRRAAIAAFAEKKKTFEAAYNSAKSDANEELLTVLRREAAKYRKASAELGQVLAARSLAEVPAKTGETRIVVEAEKFDRGNLTRDFETYGKGIGVVINGGGDPNFAEWDIAVPKEGMYQIELRYAAEESRPVKLFLNGTLIQSETAKEITGSWQPDGQKWEPQGVYTLKAGKNMIRLERNGAIPHFDKVLVASVTLPSRSPGAPASRSVEQIAREDGLNVAILREWTKIEKPDGALSLPPNPDRFYPVAAIEKVKTAKTALDDALKSEPKPEMAMAVEEGKIENCRVHLRGNTLTLGDEVPRHFLAILNGDKQVAAEKQSGRLELANWLTNPQNPLPARVAVNRLWQHHFGEGIVRTPENFGLLGERPTHPELLDWLASTFLTQGWSQKKLHKIIMLSNTYQMASTVNPKAMLADPDNRLLWRANRRRLEAEPFRDSVLAVAGTLDKTMGGSLLMTPNNDYVTNDQSGNGAGYSAPRRSLYLPIIRNALYDMFQSFDVLDPSTVNARRPTTVVSSQALFALNSPFMLEQARAFANEILKSGGSTEAERIRTAYLKALQRSPAPEEASRVSAFLARYNAVLEKKEPDTKKREQAVWQAFAQALLASNEFIHVD